MFTVPTENCPASATEALPDGEPIKIAFIGPQTGPLAAFGVIGQGMQVYFDKINEEGGIDGHNLELVTKDDAYDPARSGPAVQEAIEGDGIFASVFQVGTPNVAGTRQLHADACVPQALVGTGFPNWGDPANWPWTTGGIPSYTVESAIWTDFIKEKFPEATKVAILSFNNDFGKTYQAALQQLLPEAGLEIVADIVHEPTSDLSNEVTQLLASGPGRDHRRHHVDVLHQPDDSWPARVASRARSSTRTRASRSSSSWSPPVRRRPTCTRWSC